MYIQYSTACPMGLKSIKVSVLPCSTALFYSQCYMFYSAVVLSTTVIRWVVKALFSDVQ